MTTRDRMVIIVVLVVGAIVAGWMLVVSPKHDQGRQPQHPDLRRADPARYRPQPGGRGAGGEGRLRRPVRAARQAGRGRPAGRRRPVADLPGPERGAGGQGDLPRSAADRRGRGHDQLEHAVDPELQSSSRGSSSSSSSSPSSSSSAPAAPAQLPPGAAVGAAGLPTEQFTFTLAGNFFHLANFFNRLQNFVVSRDNSLLISGRLMTINAINLAPGPERLPADQRQRIGDHLHRPADRGPAGRRHAGRSRDLRPTPAPSSGSSTTPPAAAIAPLR